MRKVDKVYSRIRSCLYNPQVRSHLNQLHSIYLYLRIMCSDLNPSLESVVTALYLKVVGSNWRAELGVGDKFVPVDSKTALHCLPMSRGNGKTIWLLMKQEDVVMGVLGGLGGRSGSEVG